MSPATAHSLRCRWCERNDAGERALIVTIPKRPGLAFAGGDCGDPRRVRVIVSWNELQRTCQKAFRGLGVPAGADDDGSFAVLWLEARGLDGLAPLEATLSALQHTAPRPLELRLGGDEDGVDVLDAGGQSAVSVASGAVDFAIARAMERAARAEVRLRGVEGGIFVAGALAQRPVPGRCALAEWWDGKVRRRLDMAPDGACRVSAAPPDLAESDSGLGRKAVRIAIDEPGRYRWPVRDRIWRTDFDDAELERRAMHSVLHGIDMPDPLWTRLLELARRTLVPATHASRERGAGGGEYND